MPGLQAVFLEDGMAGNGPDKMKNSSIMTSIAISIVSILLIWQTNATWNPEETYAYVFTNYKEDLKRLGREHDIEFVCVIDDAFIDERLLEVSIHV